MDTNVLWLVGVSMAVMVIVALARWISDHPDVRVAHASSVPRRAPLQPQHQMDAEELVDEAGVESFPASDPPARTPLIGVGRRQ